MKNYLALIGLFISAQTVAQESPLWEDFVQAKKNGTEAILPDFSYAGYHRGEIGVPDVKHKVFNVQDYGAVANDGKSDRQAIEQAVAAAIANQSGVIFFPKGRYDLNTKGEELKSIVIEASNIVFRGEGAGKGGTLIFMNQDMPPADPSKMWTCPPMFKFTGRSKDKKIAHVTGDAGRGTFSVKVDDAKPIKPGTWVKLAVKNADPEFVKEEMAPYPIYEEWTKLNEGGVIVNEYHEVDKVKGNTIFFKEPILRAVSAKYGWEIHSYGHGEEVGVEGIAFEGNWHEDFVHHKSALHDTGYTLMQFSRLTNSWVRNCKFTNFNSVFSTGLSANISAYNCDITGTPGHSAMSANGSSRVFFGMINDTAEQWHATGISKESIGTVIWRNTFSANSCFNSHASQPRTTLFDCTTGGFFLGRAGGAEFNLPNHLRELVLWNFKETDEAEENFEFWSSKTWFWKIIPPIVVGFHGSGTTFLPEQVGILESVGTPVKPESLYEEQLKLRLGSLPNWLVTLKTTN